MNWLVYHIASGQAFFTGVALLLLAALAAMSARPRFRRLTGLAFVVGVIAVVASSTAIPYWLYAIACVVTLFWIASGFRKSWRRGAALAFVAVWASAVCLEAPYHVSPSLARADSRRLTILGDSVTAGVGGGETSETWPSIVAREHQLQVQDLSHVGETAGSALKRARAQSIDSPVLVIEIGGNDILGTTTVSQFANDLESLLAYVAAPDRQIIMFELPLPPFYHEYGRVQRALASKYGVHLVPKRVFLSVLAGDDSTLDTIHLSQAGHRAMADCVWRLVGPAFVDVGME
ncbi:MAG: GDSL-type esterase/lipase family protein [Pirellulales bacterium]